MANLEIGLRKESKGFKRICETEEHVEVELRPFEECPYCKSCSYHRIVLIKKMPTPEEARGKWN